MLIPPIRYAQGTKLCRVLALDADSLTDFYVDLSASHDVTVETKREIQSLVPDAPLLTVDALLPDLSPRQREVFATAHGLGYYELPRETTTADVAKVVGIERRTAEDHLRRAEKKMVDELVDYL
jgi:predicted DNA binding protein